MGITDYIKDKKEEFAYSKNILEAETIFLKQRESILSIKDTPGLKEIVAYWERQKNENERMFDVSTTDKPKYFALYKQSKQFLNFIENMAKG